MPDHVLVRSNWLSVNSISLDLVCEVTVEDEQQSTMMDKQQEANDDDDVSSRLVYNFCNHIH